MDSIISLRQKNTLAKYMILSGANNRPPMLDKDLYDYWKSRMELYVQNREHGRMILELIEHGPLIWPTVEKNGVIRTKKYAELSAAEKIHADCDTKATNIILQAILMANISNYGSDVILEETVQDTGLQAQQDSMILSVIEKMSEQMITHVNNWEKDNKDQNNESITDELERYKERVKAFEQRLNIDLSCLEKMIDSQMDDIIKEKLALKEKVDSLE
nr:hypothetical protein [Tanacetum cinerariifolium]